MTNIELSQYLSTLKDGDEVFIRGRTCISRGKVARLTKTQIILTSSGRYKLADGQGIGGESWNIDEIVLPTPDIRQRWQDYRLKHWAKNQFHKIFETLTHEQQLEVYRQVTALVSASKAPADS